MSFELPPALAGDNNEVSADGDGVKNYVQFIGGLSLAAVGGAVALKIKDHAMDTAQETADADGGVSFMGEI